MFCRPSGSPAELIQVSWLEVTGTFDGLKGKKYEIGFEVSLTPDAFGWNGCHVYVMAKVGKRENTLGKDHHWRIPRQGIFRFLLKLLISKLMIMPIALTTRSTSVCMKSGVGNGREVSKFTTQSSKKFL